MPDLIGLSGFKRSGKDTTYELYATHSTEHVTRVGFADRLKIMAGRALGLGAQLSDDEIIDAMNELKETGVFDVAWGVNQHVGTHFSGRQYLQWFGQEARAVFGDSFWVDQVLPNPFLVEGWAGDALAGSYPDTDVVIATDVRYPNEALRILNLGGEVIEIVRPGLESDGHSSEIPLPRDLVTTTIHNDGSIEDLRDIVIDLLIPTDKVVL